MKYKEKTLAVAPPDELDEMMRDDLWLTVVQSIGLDGILPRVVERVILVPGPDEPQ